MRTDIAPTVLTYVASNKLLGAPERLAGLKLVATDVEWSSGTGQLVSGNAEDLLLAATGRSAGLPDLTGAGVDALAERLTQGPDGRR